MSDRIVGWPSTTRRPWRRSHSSSSSRSLISCYDLPRRGDGDDLVRITVAHAEPAVVWLELYADTRVPPRFRALTRRFRRRGAPGVRARLASRSWSPTRASRSRRTCTRAASRAEVARPAGTGNPALAAVPLIARGRPLGSFMLLGSRRGAARYGDADVRVRGRARAPDGDGDRERATAPTSRPSSASVVSASSPRRAMFLGSSLDYGATLAAVARLIVRRARRLVHRRRRRGDCDPARLGRGDRPRPAEGTRGAARPLPADVGLPAAGRPRAARGQARRLR